MADSQSKRGVRPDGSEIKRLRVEQGWSQADLAEKADCSARTVRKGERGQSIDLATLRLIADAFGVDCASLLDGRQERELVSVPEPKPAQQSSAPATDMQVLFQIPFNPADPEHQPQIEYGLEYVAGYAMRTPRTRVFAVVGINVLLSAPLETVITVPAGENQARRDPDDYARVIVLVFGILDQTRPFWCYVAVKPSAYRTFLESQKTGTLNLYEFGPYGEIIISGEGTRPPDEVTLKVAEVYQTDPKKFFQPVDPEAEIERKMKQLEDRNRKPCPSREASGSTTSGSH